MKPRLYLETTIPSYLVARPNKDVRLLADQEATREWWEQRRCDFDLFVSRIVISECSRGNASLAAARLDKLHEIPVLSPSVAGEQLAERLLKDGIIPSIAAEDAAHLGFAAANNMDYLLTWNCRHINNRALQRRIESACRTCGLVCPVICTPTELMNP
ncbi:MAG: type II toxin-antitoxin system VapC family toxin [Verrucomicrobiota bacterium]